MCAAHPSATVLGGPAPDTATAAATAKPRTQKVGGWTWSADLSADELAKLQGLVALNGLGGGGGGGGGAT